METDRPGLEVIERDECLRLLAGEEIGRLAVVSGNSAVVLPVDHALDSDTVVFRTNPGTKLAGEPRASFEVDWFDREQRSGWSVVASGPAGRDHTVRRGHLQPRAGVDVDPWVGGDKAHWMRLVPDRVTGRRVGGRRPAS